MPCSLEALPDKAKLLRGAQAGLISGLHLCAKRNCHAVELMQGRGFPGALPEVLSKLFVNIMLDCHQPSVAFRKIFTFVHISQIFWSENRMFYFQMMSKVGYGSRIILWSSTNSRAVIETKHFLVDKYSQIVLFAWSCCPRRYGFQLILAGEPSFGLAARPRSRRSCKPPACWRRSISCPAPFRRPPGAMRSMPPPSCQPKLRALADCTRNQSAPDRGRPQSHAVVGIHIVLSSVLPRRQPANLD